MEISNKRFEVSCFNKNPRQCMLQVSGNTVSQVEEFVYLGVEGGKRRFNAGIGKVNVVLSVIL